MRDGEVDDPHEEFMIVEDCSVTKEELSSDGGCAYWSERFLLRRTVDPFTGAHTQTVMGNSSNMNSSSGADINTTTNSSNNRDVPSFLCQYQCMILDTGKYLNLLKSCGQSVDETLGAGVHLGM